MTGGGVSESESTDTDPQPADLDPSCYSSPADINWSSGSSTSCDTWAAGSGGGLGSSSKPHKANNDAGWEAIRSLKSEAPLSLAHFRIVHKLGSGDIGSVYLAELKGTECYFAIKAMDKKALSGRNKLMRAETEKDILETLDHPFLPTLYAHLDEAQFSCLVMEFCPGGDLHVLRQRQPGKRFGDHAARFYVSEVLLALEYLHMLGIVYRDLKPENVLVREDGHIMLTDFDLSLKCIVYPTLLLKPKESESVFDTDSDGRTTPPAMPTPSSIFHSYVLPCTSNVHQSRHHHHHTTTVSCLPVFHHFAKKKSKPPKLHSLRHTEGGAAGAGAAATTLQLLAEPTDARSMSFVGTHEYLAPEIIAGEGHGNAVDWWTLGIFLFELLYGRTPFRGSDNDKTLANVVAQALHFPDDDEDDETVLGPGPSAAAKDLIRGLLIKDPAKRMGSVRGAAEIKQHAFFRGINWALIRCSIPPHIPSPFLPPRPPPASPPDKRPTSGDFEDF